MKAKKIAFTGIPVTDIKRARAFCTEQPQRLFCELAGDKLVIATTKQHRAGSKRRAKIICRAAIQSY